MIIAFIVSITLLPALLRLFNPPGEKEPLGYASLAPVDSFMERHRIPIIVGTAVISLGGLPLLYYPAVRLQPDESAQPEGQVGRDLPGARSDPNTGANAIDVLAPQSRGRARDRRPAAQAARGQRAS